MPGASNVAEFWRNLQAGADTISRFDPDRLRAAGVPAAEIEHPGYVPARGVLAAAEHFDWRFFGYSLAEARLIDPQQRVFLEVCWAAFTEAGLDPERFPGWIGVFAGCDLSTTGSRSAPETMEGLIGAEKDFLATRVAYKLKLRGPAISVQTACSTSLVAVHQACQSLLNHECDAALAGGVTLWLPQETGYRYQEDHILSVDGRCRTFDADSTGTVSSNGAGVVLLRRLEDALADGDRIMAVLRGSALNNDGGEKIGYTAPSLTGQRDVIRLALAQADVDPADLSYVEAHGTATQLGDPVEVAALTSAFRYATDRVGYCGLGSVKSNIGHTGAAAGIAGLLKAALSLEHRELVPSLHFRRPNPKLELESSPFRVVTENEPLPEDMPALAAVSSFGIGGTNAHAVLEGPPRRAAGSPRGPKLFCLSAPSAGALRKARTELADRLTERPAPDPVAVAWTLAAGRPALPFRTAVPAEDLDRAVASLREPADAVPAARTRVGFLFPGQGALYPGAIEACYESLPVFRELFDQAARVVAGKWGLDLHAALAARAPAEQLADSFTQQVGLFSVGYALGRQLLAWGIRPAAMLGHSAGEYVAAALAGVWDLAAGLEVVGERALAMRAGPPGGMLAVYAAPEDLPPRHGLEVATEGPGQVVLAGSTERVHRLHAELADAGIEARVIDADRPFHTERMRPATDGLRAVLARLPAGRAELPVVSNLTGRLAEPDRLADPGYWSEHLCSPVRLTEGMATVLGQGCEVLIELGPGQTMTGGLRRHERWSESGLAVPFIGRQAEPRRDALLGALGRLWEAGLPLDWAALFEEPPVRCWLPPVPLDSEPIPERQAQAGGQRPAAQAGMVVVGDQPARVAALAEELVDGGATVVGSHAPSTAKPLADPVIWPERAERTVADRPDLTDALREFSAGLAGQVVLDSGVAALTADGRLPRLAGFLLDLLRARGWLTGEDRPVADLGARVAAALARAGELDEVAGLRELLRHCAAHYPDVFAGRVEPVSVLYPDGSDDLLSRCLRDNAVPLGGSGHCLEAVRRSIPAWYERRGGEPLRVLEIGAGRGGLTWPLLDAWAGRDQVTYDVTEVSPMLVAQLRRRAAERGERGVRARTFDITADPVQQGLIPGSYDLILGYNVVHVAPSVPAALGNLRRLLRENGTLCLIELTRAESWTHLVWGLAPGWWNAEDHLRGSSPELALTGWHRALTEAGFAPQPDTGPAGAEHAVLVATLADRDGLGDPAADVARQATGAEPVIVHREPTAPPAPRNSGPPETTPAGQPDALVDTLTELWCDALGVTSAAAEDDFYRLGGESLGLVHLLGQVRERTGVRVQLTDFATRPTFGVLLRWVREQQETRSPSTPPNLVRLAEHGDGVPLVFTAPGAGSTLCYRHLVPQLGAREPVYGLETPGLHDGVVPLTRIEDLAAANLELLREIRPNGPYRLAGWSVGAMVAHEMAARLLADGERVDSLLCIDGFVPRTWGAPVGALPGYLGRGLWYQLETALPAGLLGRDGNLGDALGLAGQRQGAEFVRVYRANVRALLRYVPRPIDCAAVIFKTGLTARVRRRVERSLRGTYRRGARVVGVPGDHHSVLAAEHVDVLAERMREVLDHRGSI